ncbi:TasA family protein [Bacillus horti]|uniref:Spore coat-associated protein N n=1 Tax=Caldalkalibacillus horti TaxID=77523 RepID=A0ABT9W422_9BACI|nr:TasA family protein [Bacillus horti]MDQ0167991.1 spore coat-associated protein N [Bacillus horti]
MTIKRKLTMGAISATLGLALIGGGTWAAFNDIETASASLAAGKLDLVVDLQKADTSTHLINVSNLKPGDSMERTFRMKNNGTLAIKDVLMSVEYDGFAADTSSYNSAIPQNTDAVEFLSQFQVEVLRVGTEGSGEFPKEIISESDNITLSDIYYATTLDGVNGSLRSNAQSKLAGAIPSAYWVDNRINVATVNPDQWTGLPVVPHDDDDVLVVITFIDDESKNANGLYDQNAFQANSINVYFDLEARQWEGIDVQPSDIGNGARGSGADGYIQNNERAKSGRP